MIGRFGRIAHDVAPDVQIALGDTGVGCQHEQYRVRAGDQRQRQLGLRADRVQPRRIQDHQALLEQRMRKIDHRVTPARDFDQVLLARPDHLVGIVRVEQAVHPRLVDADPDGLGHQLKGLEHAVRRGRIDRKNAPFARTLLEVGHRPEPGTRFDRERPDTGRQRLVVHQLGRAHRGAPGRGRQDAAPVIGEEDRVDQFGLAARELGNERHHEAVAI